MTTQIQSGPLPQIIRAGEGQSIDTRDTLLLFKLASREPMSGCSLALSVTQPGGGPPPHLHHRDAELFLVVEGELQVGSVQGWQTVRAGDVVFLPARGVHTFRNTGTRPSKHWVLLTAPDFEAFYAKFAAILNAAHDGPPDVQRLQAAAAEYGIEFVSPDAVPGIAPEAVALP